MKNKTISIISAAALLSASLLVFVVCQDSEKDKRVTNPVIVVVPGDGSDSGVVCPGCPPGGGPGGDSLCDGVNPTIKIIGAASMVTTTKPGDEASANELKKWLHLDGGSWLSIIEYSPGTGGSLQPIPQEPCLTRDGGNGECIAMSNVRITRDTLTLEPGGYTIRYRVVKDACNDMVPSAVATRSLIVTKYVPPVGEITITLLGSNPAQVKEGGTYVDAGAIVSIGGTLIPSAIDSVVVRNSQNTVISKLLNPNGNFSGVKLSANPSAGSTFTVTYYASYRDPTGQVATPKTAVRTVMVVDDQTTLPAVIVLNPYTHKLKSGKEVKWPDTMLYSGSGVYVERGAKAYTGTGEEIAGVNLTITTPIFGNDNITKQVDYRVNAGNGYGAASKKRNVHMVDNSCDDKTAPIVNVSVSEIPAGTPWDYITSWSVINKDENGGGAAFKYFIDFNGLDPDKPVAKAGGYKITFVGLGKCGGITEMEKTITVK